MATRPVVCAIHTTPYRNPPRPRQGDPEPTAVNDNLLAELSGIRLELRDVNEQLNGDPLLVMDDGHYRMSLKGKTDLIISSLWTTTSGSTGTFERAYEEANSDFSGVLSALNEVDARIKNLQDQLEQAGAPYTPGRAPIWE